MTYCVGILLQDGVVLASDSRTNAGVDNFSSFCKMSVFERQGDRVIVLLSSGNLAGTQAVVSILKQRAEVPEAGKAGPITWQMHNKGHFDEYRDVRIEVDPKTNELITTK